MLTGQEIQGLQEINPSRIALVKVSRNMSQHIKIIATLTPGLGRVLPNTYHVNMLTGASSRRGQIQVDTIENWLMSDLNDKLCGPLLGRRHGPGR